jgi:hypothetical protein
MLRTTVSSVCLAALLVGAAVTIHADVVFFNVTSTADVSSGSIVCGGSNGACLFLGGLIEAEAFTPVADYTMTDAQVLVEAPEAVPGDSDFNVFLYSNSSGVPGSPIEQIGFGLAAAAAYSLITADTIATPITLTSGTEYWLVLKPADSGSFINWGNGGSPSVPFAYSANGGSDWDPGTNTDQFQIDGAPVSASIPEPSSLLLLATVALPLYLCGAKLSARHTTRIGS